MAITSAIMQMRRGLEADFDPDKMKPGEWAVSTDKKYVRMCFSVGVCVRMATYEAFEADMEQIREILAECQTVEEAVQRIYEDIKDVAVDVERIEAAAASALESEENALDSANSAVQSANTATQKATEAAGSANIASAKAEQATEGANTATQKASEAAESADNVRNMSDVSQSYAVGGTGTREGEDTDNAKYYNQQASDNADRAEAAAERASAVADVGVATKDKAGIVKPDGTTITVDEDGTIHASEGTTDYEDLENKPQIEGVELSGNKTLSELGIASADDLSTANENIDVNSEKISEVEVKVDTIIEKAELNIKNSASGKNIHLTDSANGKNVAFGLYGKADQKQYSGKNLLENTATTKTVNGVTFTVNDDGSVIANGTATAKAELAIQIQPNIADDVPLILSGCPSGGGLSTYRLQYANFSNSDGIIIDYGNGATITEQFDYTTYPNARIMIRIESGQTVNNLTFHPMLSAEGGEYEPYVGGIPSPNPEYPQEITVSGSDGSVEVVTENEDSTQSTTAIIPTPDGLAGIKVSSGGNYTDENGQQWICDEVVKYADGSGKRIQRIGVIDSYNGESVTTDYMSTTGQLTNGAKVIYILPTPIITDLTAEEIAEIEKLHTFYPITNISNDADCGMAVTYMADAKNYIDNRLALLETALVNSI